MNISTIFLPELGTNFDFAGKTAVCIDVLRASTSIITGLESGARGLIPVANPEDAFALRGRLDEDVLLCGERSGTMIPGFDLGNSPFEYTPEQVGGRLLILCTTNGTRTMLLASKANSVHIAGILNMDAIANRIADCGDVAIVCSGTEGKFSLEDALCAGGVIKRLRVLIPESSLCDSSVAAESCFLRFQDSLSEALSRSDHGSFLTSLGFERDLERAASINGSELIPTLERRKLGSEDVWMITRSS